MKTRWIEFTLLTATYLIILMIIVDQSGNDLVNQYVFLSRSLCIYVVIMWYLLYIYPVFFLKQKMVQWLLLTSISFLGQNLILLWIYHEFPFNSQPKIPVFVLSGMTFLSLLIYTALKAGLTAFLKLLEQTKRLAEIGKDFLIVFTVSVVIFTLTSFLNVSVAAITAVSILLAYTLFAIHAYALLPYLETGKITKPISITLSLLIGVVCTIVSSSLDKIIVQAFTYGSLDGVQIVVNGLLVLLLTPLIYAYYFQNKQKKQVLTLRKELGQASADLKLLQSQVNPHFLFNVMNTLYGIALQEQASRTASGIEKLSSMMRFMIHENQQNYILLSRELAYLKEYIELQKLRVDGISSIEIIHNLPDEYLDKHYIAPMLLIPFVENAFKHGISINNPSWIRIHLDIDQNRLKFNVYNSIHHSSSDEDIERNKSGIGLPNAKHRLNLIYPNGHELHIEETTNEFFVFLTIELTEDN